MGTLFCSGTDFEGSNIEFDCDADLDLGLFKNMTQFYVGNLKINSNEIKFKLSLHNFKTLDELYISISNESDCLKESGIVIKKNFCWSKMIQFFLYLTQRKLLYEEYDLAILKIL